MMFTIRHASLEIRSRGKSVNKNLRFALCFQLDGLETKWFTNVIYYDKHLK